MFCHFACVQSFAVYLAARVQLCFFPRRDGKGDVRRLSGFAGSLIAESQCQSLTPSHLHDLSKNLHIALREKRNRLSGQNKHTYCVLLLSTGQNVHVVIFTLFASARNLFPTFYHLIDWFRVCHFHFVCFATG